MLGRKRKDRVGRFSAGQETVELNPAAERSGSFGDGQQMTEPATRRADHGRFSTGQERFPADEDHDRVGHFSDGQERPVGARRARNDHGLPQMGFRVAFARRKQVTSRASEQGLIEAANRSVFHDRGYTLTWDTETGDLWLTPTGDPDGWSYEEDAG